MSAYTTTIGSEIAYFNIPNSHENVHSNVKLMALDLSLVKIGG